MFYVYFYRMDLKIYNVTVNYKLYLTVIKTDYDLHRYRYNAVNAMFIISSEISEKRKIANDLHLMDLNFSHDINYTI